MLSSLAFGELDADAAETQALHAHIAGCEVCREKLGDLRLTANLLKQSIDAQPVLKLSSTKRAKLMMQAADDELRQRGRMAIGPFTIPIRPLGIAASLGLLAFAGWGLFGPGGMMRENPRYGMIDIGGQPSPARSAAAEVDRYNRLERNSTVEAQAMDLSSGRSRELGESDRAWAYNDAEHRRSGQSSESFFARGSQTTAGPVVNSPEPAAEMAPAPTSGPMPQGKVAEGYIAADRAADASGSGAVATTEKMKRFDDELGRQAFGATEGRNGARAYDQSADNKPGSATFEAKGEGAAVATESRGRQMEDKSKTLAVRGTTFSADTPSDFSGKFGLDAGLAAKPAEEPARPMSGEADAAGNKNAVAHGGPGGAGAGGKGQVALGGEVAAGERFKSDDVGQVAADGADVRSNRRLAEGKKSTSVTSGKEVEELAKAQEPLMKFGDTTGAPVPAKPAAPPPPPAASAPAARPPMTPKPVAAAAAPVLAPQGGQSIDTLRAATKSELADAAPKAPAAEKDMSDKTIIGGAIAGRTESLKRTDANEDAQRDLDRSEVAVAPRQMKQLQEAERQIESNKKLAAKYRDQAEALHEEVATKSGPALQPAADQPASTERLENTLQSAVAMQQAQQESARKAGVDEKNLAQYEQKLKQDPNALPVIVSGKLGELNAQSLELGQVQAEPVDDTLPPSSSFNQLPVNPFVMTDKDRFSTFAMDVDTASYALCRRYIRAGYRPPAGAVRMEEFVNAFDYNYDNQSPRTFAIHTQAAAAPFGEHLTLLKIGVKAKTIGREGRKPANLVFVIDASGSMEKPDRMPLVQSALRMLVDELGPGDHVSIVTYGSQATLALEAAPAENAGDIRRSIDAIQTGGSTNMTEGLKLGYDIARRHFVSGAINQIILCSDGVANVGETDAQAMLDKVVDSRKQGIALTSVGFGLGAYNDAIMEKLADSGDGQYIFVDTPAEAQRVFVDQMAATLQTVAKDAKIQVEFNPQRVRRYRLVGYENRDIADKDFRNDAVDAGEVGSGQSVTALYEVELLDGEADLGTVFVRYKNVDTDQVEEISRRLRSDDVMRDATPTAQPRFYLAASAAEFAEILRNSEHARGGSLEAVERTLIDVTNALPLDQQAAELLELVQSAKGLPPAP
ncbi:MAG: DUF3520 domain-containing protein [Planctomycetes bacterium]|nr:DUF3520 domain-containing protein [Planctomycetota bacterium]